MLVTIIIFFISIVSLFGMVMFRAWEIKTSRNETPLLIRKIVPEIYFRQIEKIMLYLTKHIVQWIVLVSVKYFYIVLTKTRKWTRNNLPKISKYFKSKAQDIKQKNDSFVKRAINESKAKIKRIKEKVRKEHED